MANKSFNVVVHDLNIVKPASVRLLIAQIQSEEDDWTANDGLYFYKDVDAGYDQVDKILSNARQSTVDMVILPELSVLALARLFLVCFVGSFLTLFI